MSRDCRLSGVKLGDTGDDTLVCSSEEVRKGDGKREPGGSRGLDPLKGNIGKLMGDDKVIVELPGDERSNRNPLLSALSSFNELLPILLGTSRTIDTAASSAEDDGEDEEEEEEEEGEDWAATEVSADMCGGD